MTVLPWPAHPGQAAGHGQVGLAPGDGEGPQHAALGLQAVVAQGRHRRQGEVLLADPEVGSVLDAPAELVELGHGLLPAVDDVAGELAGDGLDDQPVEVGQHVAAADGVAAPPGGHRWQLEGLAEQSLGQPGQERDQAWVFEDPAAEGVDHRHRAQPAGLDQAGHAESRVAFELEGIAKPGVDPAQDDVDGLQSAQGPHPDPARLDGQIRPLDQGVAEVGGEEGVLEGRLAVRARGQDHDPGVGRRRGATACRPVRKARKNGASRWTWASR